MFEDGSVAIFGNNASKQCEIPNGIKDKRVKQVVLGRYHLALLFEDRSVAILGDNS